MKKILILAFTIVSIIANSQTPFNKFLFDNEIINLDTIKKRMAESEFAHVGHTPTYSPGLSGYALDLTDDVGERLPLFLDKSEIPAYNKDFAISIWVKTKINAHQGTPIMSNKKNGERTSAGWTIGTSTNGAWFFNISDGKNTYNYEPTPQRQAINDGAWHHIALSIDMKNKEMWMYYDGRNVAIYNIESITDSIESELQTVIGGTDEYNDWGSRGEWTAFNGMIDEVEIYNTTISAKKVQETYQRFFPDGATKTPRTPQKLKIQTWNIWHGGHRYGEHVGVARTIDVIKGENADVVGLIETYGSGAIIADSLDYYFYLISSNLSIMSRYPIENTVKVFKSFFSGGAVIDLGHGNKIAFFDIWLNYSPDMCGLFAGASVLPDFLEKEKLTRQKEIKTILSEIDSYIKNSDKVPVFVAGDFNCGSHLDWTEKAKDQFHGLVVDWQTSRMMINAGFKDSFREINPNGLRDPGFTWSPLINNASPNQNCIRDRIDFIYYKGKKILPYRSRVLENHAKLWPSDHATVISSFYTNW